jgi:HEAT repeat protein
MLFWTLWKLKSKKSANRLDAVKSLAAALHDPRVIKPLIAVFNDFDSDAVVCKAAIEALKNSRDERAVLALAETVCNGRDREEYALPRADLLIVALKHPSSDIRKKAAWGIRLETPDVARIVEPLLLALNDVDDDVKQAAIEALGRVGDARAIEPLRAALEDDNFEIRASAAASLGKIDDARVVGLLCAALNDVDYHVQMTALDALVTIGNDRAVEPLIAVLKSSHARLRQKAVEGLGKLGDARAAGPLCIMLNDVDRNVKGAAVEALGKLGDAHAVGPLISAVKHINYEFHSMVIEALEKLSDVRTIELLCAALDDDDSRTREIAIIVLGKIDDPRVVEPLRAALNDVTRDVPQVAVEALRKLAHGRGVEPLIAALGSNDIWVREGAARALGGLADARALGPLRAALNDATVGVRRAACEALHGLGWYPGKETRIDIVTRSSDLGVILGFPEAIDPAVKALFKKPSDLTYVEKGRSYLENTVPRSSLTLEIANLIFIASSYESRMKQFQFWDLDYSVKASDAAVLELCRLVSPVSTNILHLIKDKKTLEIPMSDDDGRSWTDSVAFWSQREYAESELKRRGNPPYDPEAYLKH